MSILKVSTKIALVTYFGANNFTVTNSESDTRCGMWNLKCLTCQSPNEIRVATLIQLKRTGAQACCRTCKNRNKIENFLHYCNMIEIDDRHIKCGLIDCGLTYRYCGDYFDNFQCYCRGQIKGDEKVVYQYLQEKFPDAIMGKEKLYRANHKVDIYLEHEGRRFLIEVDDESHFKKTGKAQRIDKNVMDTFVQENEEDTFFIRIPIKAIYKPDFGVVLEDFIRTVQNENAKILLFQVSGLNRYLPLEIPENEIETYRV